MERSLAGSCERDHAGSLYALVGLGFVVIFRATKVVNFAQGEMMMLGAMLALISIAISICRILWLFVLAVVLSGVFGAGSNVSPIGR